MTIAEAFERAGRDVLVNMTPEENSELSAVLERDIIARPDGASLLFSIATGHLLTAAMFGESRAAVMTLLIGVRVGMAMQRTITETEELEKLARS